MARVGGTVKWFSNRKGYGFVTPNNGGDDLFVHFSGMKVTEGSFRGLNAGEEVEFKIERDEKKGKDLAVDVTWPDNKPIDRPYRTREAREQEDGEKPAQRSRVRADGNKDEKKAAGGDGDGGDKPKRKRRPRSRGNKGGEGAGGEGAGAGEGKDDQARESKPRKEIPDLPPIKREGAAINGVVKWFSYSKGYGFITRQDTNEDVFVHRRALYSKIPMPILVDEQKVELSLSKDDSGRAVAADVSAPGGLGLPRHKRLPRRNDNKDDE